ncbi:MAG: hypothetical protein WC437_04720 [Patescibacteria group bacterium]
MKNIAVVVPTIRPETIPPFLKAWKELFDKHNVEFVLVVDGKDQHIVHNQKRVNLKSDLVSKFSAGCKQLGFLYIAERLPEVEYIIVLDDDCFPIGNPIQDHIDQLNRKVPISWLSTASDYMRGFPYQARQEAPVMLSHGVWEGNYDWDAPSQLLKSDTRVDFYKGIIPKGIFFPMCGMNIAFRREALPYIYFAPVGKYKGAERFDDIWAGLEIVKDFAKLNWGIVSGYARVNHSRASNVFTSLEKEAVGIRKNEEYWQGKYDEWYKGFVKKRKKWYNITKKNV